MGSEKEGVRIFWKWFFHRLLYVSSLVFVLMLGSAAAVQSATVTGTVFQENGITPITGTVIHVSAYAGDPCLTFVGFDRWEFSIQPTARLRWMYLC